jgi:hypothetical protein
MFGSQLLQGVNVRDSVQNSIGSSASLKHRTAHCLLSEANNARTEHDFGSVMKMQNINVYL